MNIKLLLPESLGGKAIRNIYRAQKPASFSGLSVTGLHQARKLIPLEVSFAGHIDSGELLTTCIIRDVTSRTEQENEKLALETQVQAAQKMEAVGQLTGGIAHDFNNLLVAILGYTELAEHDPAPIKRQHYLSEIKKASERGRNMTQQLLTFSRKKALTRSQINLDKTLEGLVDFISRLLPSNIDVQFLLDANDCYLMADTTQLEQVMINLAVNARDAMPQGGTLTIRTRVEGDIVCIIVSDTGAGMDEETKQKLFEPFFTTKAEGHGTGLGLSVVFGIVRQHKGTIDVVSAPGEGATFTLEFSRATDRTRVSDTPPERTPSPSNRDDDADTPVSSGKTATILIVEDNEQVRQLATLILKGAAYRVLEASTGDDALECISSQQQRIDAVLINVVLPKGSGLEVVEAMLQLKPDTHIAFMSGYPMDHPQVKQVITAGYHLIKKPFSTEDLRQQVAAQLELPDFSPTAARVERP